MVYIEISKLPCYRIKSIVTQKNLVLMMARAQQEVGITAGKLGLMDLNSYRHIMKLIYNFLAFYTTLLD